MGAAKRSRSTAAKRSGSARKSTKKSAATAAGRTAKKTSGKAAKKAAKKVARKAAKKSAPASRAGDSTRTARTPAKTTKRSTVSRAASTKKSATKTRPAAKKATKKAAKKAAKKVAKKVAKKAARPKATTKAPAAAPPADPAPRKKKKTKKPAAATSAAPENTRSQELPETQTDARVKTTRGSKAAKTSRSGRKIRKPGNATLPLVTPTMDAPAGTPKKKREKRPKPPAKTMSAPEPVREVLVFGEIPDVRRALTARQRRERSRGHLQPTATDSDEAGLEGERQPLDATLIMNTLAVDVQPKIEDNYDYSVLDEFRDSSLCPRPTRMVNTGCGGGEAAVYFAKLGFNCVGIDPDRADVGLARERAWLAGVDVDFMVGDLFETPNLLPAESFGLAVDRGAFFRIEDERDRQRYLSNIKRLLFQGGILLLSAGYFPMDEDAAKARGKKGGKILLAREGGVVVQEMRAAGFELMRRILRPTTDSGELGELLLYLRK